MADSVANKKLAALLRECASYVETDTFDPVIYQVLGDLHAYAGKHGGSSPSASDASKKQEVSKPYNPGFGLGGLGKKLGKLGLSPKEQEKRQSTSTKNAERARADLEEVRVEQKPSTVTESSAVADTTTPAKPRPGKPSFQRPVNPSSTLVANGWIEQQRRSKMRVVWKDILASLVEGRKPNEETTLWIQREVTNTTTGKPELEALHQIPIKWLEDIQYLDFYGDHRFSLKVFNVPDEFLFRCADEDSAQNWVLTLRSVREIVLRNKRKGAEERNGNKSPTFELRPSSAVAATTEGQTNKRMTVKELRAIAHGAGVNTSGMERAELEGVVARILGNNGVVPSAPPDNEKHHREIEAARLREEQARIDEQRRREEQQRLQEEQEAKERLQEEARLVEQRRQLEEEARRRVAEQREEEKRRAAVAAAADEKRRVAAEADEQRRLAEEQRRVEEQRRAEEQRRVAEEHQRRLAELQKQQQQAAERRRQEEERKRLEEEQRRRYAEQQAAEQRRRQEEAQRQYQQQQQQWQQYQQQQQQWQHQQWQRQQEAQQQQQRYYAQQHQQSQPHYPQNQGFYPNAQPNTQQQHQQQAPPPGPQHQASMASMKYAKMADQSNGSDGQEKITAIKRNLLVHWALQPPTLQMLRPIAELLIAIHTVFPPAFGVAGHDYFSKWKALSRDDVMQGAVLDEDKLKKAVRKLRFFLHPDKLPRDLNEEQQFMCKMLWDVSNDAWDEFTKRSQELDWVQK